jgi:Cu(I)/Ag(I) efflux system membrane fusion protein
MKTFSLFLLLALAALAGWFAGTRSPSAHLGSAAPNASGERRPKFYQSAMHPWIKSDKPGKCTICGMDLTPVYEGDTELSAEAGLVTLSSNQLTVIHVATEPVRRAAITRTFRVAGTLEDNDQRHRFLSASVDGRLDRLFVNQLGAEVVAGQPLAAVYSPMLLTAVREFLAARSAPGGGLAAAAALRLRQLGLAEDQIAQLPTNFGSNQLTVELLAPMTGTVVAKDVYAGQYVKEGDKLFELADFSSMWFVFDAYERDLAWLKPGLAVEVTAPSLPGQVFTNVIAFIDPNLKDDTRSAKVRVELPNPLVEEGGQARRLIRHRAFADGRVRVETAPLLVVPRSAVLSPGGQAVVYVERGNGAYEQRAVSLGRSGDDVWEVTAGLAEGERVVTRGNLLLDSQAQLNADVSAAATPTGTITNAPALLPAQQAAVREFLLLADRLRDTLAADNLEAYNAAAPPLRAGLPKLGGVLREAGGWDVAVARLEAAAQLEAAPSLEVARRQFHTFSDEIVALAKRVRAGGGFADLRVFQCPMTKKSFPGAPARAEWLQFSVPVRNPYFGAEMLDCGTEVKAQ